MDVIGGPLREKETFEWNGDVKDRAKAREAFEAATASGAFLAIVQEGPGKAKQVRTFEEIEKIEKEQGTVTVQVSPALVGG